MIRQFLQHFSLRATPQSAPIPGSSQVPNSAGGYAWPIDDWARFDRFLVLGTEGGTFYVGERPLTVENAEAVLRCIATDGPRAVARIVELSTSGRAPKNGPAIFALAAAMKRGDDATRAAARAAVPAVARTGTHLFQLAEAVHAFGGWGRGTQRAFGDWYAAKAPADVAYQAVKYPSREGWSGRDVLRKAHVKPPTAEHDAIFRWMTRGWEGDLPDAPSDALRAIWAFEEAKRADSVARIVALITEFGLVREAIPTRWLQHAEVWEALLESGRGMPMTALLRNLAKMTEVGLLAPMSDAVKAVVARLGDERALAGARIHPLAVLVALTTYQGGRGVRGKLVWEPVQAIVDALDGAFYTSFRSVEPTGRRVLLGLDVSGSMAMGVIAGLPGITPRVGAAAMAMVTARTEPNHVTMAFQDAFVPLRISPRQRLDDVVAATSNLRFGATDCAQPMRWALEHRVPVDVFVVYTDSETWHGSIHPAQALREYRRHMGIPAKLVVVGMVSNGFSIADPNDAGMLDVVGFDAAAPAVLRDFAVA